MLGRPEELDHLLEDIFSASPPLPSLSRPVWVSRTRRSSGPSWTSTTSIPSPSSLSTPGCGRTCTAAPPDRSCSPPSWPPAAPPVLQRRPGDSGGLPSFLCPLPGAGLMMGRGLVADPALASKAKGGPGADRDTLRAFHDALYEGLCP